MLHFYEGQVRKFLTQFIRILSNFSVETGRGKDDEIKLRAVPVVYGDPTRQVANIIRNNSENALQYASEAGSENPKVLAMPPRPPVSKASGTATTMPKSPCAWAYGD